VRIELLQGPGAWCAGAVAYSGAINIITALPDKSGATAGISVGAYDFQNAEITTALRKNRWQATASAGKNKSTGHTTNTDFDIGNVYAQARYAAGKRGTFDGQFGYQQKNYGANSFYTPAYPNQFDHTETWLGSLRYHLEQKRWGLAATAYFREHYDRYELVRSNPPYNYHRTDVSGALVQLNYVSSIGTTTAGVNYRYEHIFSNKLGEPMSEPVAVKGERDNNALYTHEKTREHITGFLQHTLRLRKFHATLGVMGAGNNDYGFHGYAGFNLSYEPLQAWQFTAALNNSYRLPTFTDLYYTSPAQQGNPDLQPEQALNGELTARFRQGYWRASATGFYRYGYRMIDWVRHPGELKWYAQNLTDVHYYGTNFLVEYVPHGKFLKKAALSYNYLYMQPKASEMESNYAVDYLKHRLTCILQHGIWSHLAAAWQLTYATRAGSYLNYAAQTEMNYKPYWLCDLKIYWETRQYAVFAEATNLFNVAYSDIANVPQPGRWVKVGIQVKI